MNLNCCQDILDKVVDKAKSQNVVDVYCGSLFPVVLTMCGIEFKGKVETPYYYYNNANGIDFYISAPLEPNQVKIGQSIIEVEI